jgi:VWFA-related protein
MIVDVVERDQQGQPVSKLAQKEITVSEKVGWVTTIPAKIQSFRMINLASSRTTRQSLRAPAKEEASSDPDAPLTVLLIDGLNTELSAPIRQQLATMADTLTDRAPVALLLLGKKLEILQDFSSDPRELQSTLRRTFSVNPPPARNISSTKDANRRAQMTMAAVRSIARHLAGIPGRKKLLWISSAFPFRISPDPSATGAEDILDYRYQTAQLSNALTGARVAVYPAQPPALGSDPPSPQPPDGSSPPRVNPDFFSAVATMKGLALETGGIACFDDMLGDCLKRVLRDGVFYYEIRYQPSATDPQKGFHRIQITGTRRDAHLSFPRYYYVPGTKPAGADFELKQAACDDPLTATALKLTAQPGPGAARFSLMVDGNALSEVPSPDKPGHIRLRLDFAVCSFDAEGNQLQHFQYPSDQDLSAEEFRLLRQDGFHGSVAFQADPRATSLRWLVRNPQTGELGSVDIPYNPQNSATVVIPAQTPEPAAQAPAALPSPAEHQIAVQSPSPSAAEVTNPAAVAPPTAMDPDSRLRPYCQAIAGSADHAQALADICVSALSLSGKMPNVICDREMQRYSRDMQHPTATAPDTDVITATVAYESGREHYTNLKRNGQPAPEMLPALTGDWSMGEFASILELAFAPANNGRFRFLGEKKLHSVPALVFDFEVGQDDNELYYLRAMFANGNGTTFFPSYAGKIWLNQSNLQLLRLERETGEIPSFYPINRVTTVVDYSDLPLGDGTHFVLPVKSEIETCSVGEEIDSNKPLQNRRGLTFTGTGSPSCAFNIVRFTNWRKFAARSRIVDKEGPQ